ncbi:hypothetical protein EYF80_003529 [Liparis tanakae]|uniref:Uncharacterized protein n=1 Tax=Liparis tanakae TaxID=230148 RepID=A0A4Z2J9L2_9TELE|nr:hypothetical protein EYF80_003529 [Liparis tanakae]
MFGPAVLIGQSVPSRSPSPANKTRKSRNVPTPAFTVIARLQEFGEECRKSILFSFLVSFFTLCGGRRLFRALTDVRVNNEDAARLSNGDAGCEGFNGYEYFSDSNMHKDSSNVLLFVLADCTNGPTTFVLGVFELLRDTTTALKPGHLNGGADETGDSQGRKEGVYCKGKRKILGQGAAFGPDSVFVSSLSWQLCPRRRARRNRVRPEAAEEEMSSWNRQRGLHSILALQRGEPPLRRVAESPGSPGGACRGGRGAAHQAAHQAVQREGGPRLNHVDPPDGDQEARGPARRLGVQREVTQEGVGAARPRGMWGGAGRTDVIHELQQNKGE